MFSESLLTGIVTSKIPFSTDALTFLRSASSGNVNVLSKAEVQ